MFSVGTTPAQPSPRGLGEADPTFKVSAAGSRLTTDPIFWPSGVAGLATGTFPQG